MLMAERLAIVGLQYTVYFLEFALVAFLARKGQLRRLLGLSVYLVGLLLIDAMGRPIVLYRFGFNSPQFAYVYWLSDAFLELTAFALVCVLFRRACEHEEKLWKSVKLALRFVFVLVLGISLVSLSSHQSQLLTRFIIEFEQNLYFTCLVLNTLLYILLQQTRSGDEELGFLVCGLGIQFAGPAAGYALIHLTPGWVYATIVNDILGQLCTLGMLLTWFYAVSRVPQAVPALSTAELALSPAEGSARSS
jgi:hypothetical protein